MSDQARWVAGTAKGSAREADFVFADCVFNDRDPFVAVFALRDGRTVNRGRFIAGCLIAAVEIDPAAARLGGHERQVDTPETCNDRVAHAHLAMASEGVALPAPVLIRYLACSG